MENNISIRNAAAADAEIIYGFISHLEERTFDPLRFRERYTGNLGSPDLIYLVAVGETGEVIGFLSCHGQTLLHHEQTVFEIQELYVARNWRDRGVGKMLVAALEDRLAKIPCEQLEVSAHVKRSDTRKFYARLGFVQTFVRFVKDN